MSLTEQANYPTDLTDEQWQILRKLLPQPSRRGAPQRVCRRAVINAILYLLSAARLASPAARVPQVEDGLRDLPQLAQRRNLAEDPRFAPGQTPTARGSQDLAQRGDHRQPDGQDDRGRWPTGLRCRQEDQRSQAAHRRRYLGADLGGRGPRGERPRLRRGGSGLGHPRAVEDAIPPPEGRLRRQACLWSKQPAGVREGRVRVVAANRASGQPIVKGFVVLPKRWIVERTFGWLGRYRRHSKDYERNTASSEAMIYIAMSHRMLDGRRLRVPCQERIWAVQAERSKPGRIPTARARMLRGQQLVQRLCPHLHLVPLSRGPYLSRHRDCLRPMTHQVAVPP